MNKKNASNSAPKRNIIQTRNASETVRSPKKRLQDYKSHESSDNQIFRKHVFAKPNVASKMLQNPNSSPGMTKGLRDHRQKQWLEAIKNGYNVGFEGGKDP